MDRMLCRMAEKAPVFMWAKDEQRKILFANKIAKQKILCSEGIEVVGKTETYFMERQKELGREYTFGRMSAYTDNKVLASGIPLKYTEEGKIRGEYLCLEIQKSLLHNEQGELLGIMAIGKDITKMVNMQQDLKKKQEAINWYIQKLENYKLMQEKLRRTTEEQNLLLESVPVQMWYLKDVNVYGRANRAFLDFWNIPNNDALVGKSLEDILGEDNAKIARKYNKEVFRTGRVIQYEYWITDAYNRQRFINVTRTPKLNQQNEVGFVVCSAIDNTELVEADKKIREVYTYDPLTGFYNRWYFEEELKRLNREQPVPMAVVICDIDGLKIVNDALGHAGGDELIMTAADVLQKSFRVGDFLARTGGDEFCALLPYCSPRDVETIINRIREKVELFNHAKQQFKLNLSVGWAVKEEKDIDLKKLLHEADNNMYREKLLSGKSVRSDMVNTMIEMLRERDYVLEGHIKRLKEKCMDMAQHLNLPERTRNDLVLLAQFHDLGKVGVSDTILFKPDRLNEEEYEEMKKHSEIGYRIAISSDTISDIAELILKHHEWWDGSGYPLGLQGEDIPIECRILHIVDAFDAMTHERPYKAAMSESKAMELLQKGKGKQFDPQLVDAFLALQSKEE